MDSIENFLPEQYAKDKEIDINHNYLQEQFSDHDIILDKIKDVVIRGDFTLGNAVDKLEQDFAKLVGSKFAIGVGSGTDALFLSLKANGIGIGDEVITTSYTFYATIGAIVTAGAKPVFVDALDDYNINPDLIEEKITSATKAIIPVHWSGKPCEMDRIETIAKANNLVVISDACHAINASYKGRPVGTLGDVSCFSFHPLKNLNVWGDGGIIATDNENIANTLKLIRNHGLLGRDECHVFAYNSRLDTIQAVVAQHMLEKIEHITDRRIENAEFFDSQLSTIHQITIPQRSNDIKQVYHLYSINLENRDEMVNYLRQRGVDAKIHYPTPMHLQPAAQYLGYSPGDLPVSEQIARSTMSLPVHEFISREKQLHVVDLIRAFYEK